MVEVEPRDPGWYPAPGKPDGVEQYWTGTTWADLYHGLAENHRPQMPPPPSAAARFGCAVLVFVVVVVVVGLVALNIVLRGLDDSPVNPGPNFGNLDDYPPPPYPERVALVWDRMSEPDRIRVCRVSTLDGLPAGAAMMVEVSPLPAGSADEMRVVEQIVSSACCAPSLGDPRWCPPRNPD